MVALSIETQAKYLAEEYRKTEPDVQRVLWFPHEAEVRLIEITPQIPTSSDGEIHAVYFRPAPKYKLPAPSRIAMIQPSELGRLRLPRDWGNWNDAREI